MYLEETRPKLSSWSPIGAIGSMPASSSSRRRGSIRHTAVPKAQVYPLAFLFLAFALVFTACTDYVQQIDDQIDELEAKQSETMQSSSSNGLQASSEAWLLSADQHYIIYSDGRVTDIWNNRIGTFVSRGDSTVGNLVDNDGLIVVENIDLSLLPKYDSDAIAVTSSSSSVKPQSSSSSAKSSSSETMSSSSSADVIPGSSSNVVIPGLIGNLTDARDGQTYRTVTIGTQTWMAENLNYETENSYCYGDDASNCTKYGRLYTWAAAMDSVGTWSTNGKGCGDNKTCSPTYPVRGVCPEGWHLPTRAEFKTLITAVGGESIAGQKLKSTTGWTACSGIINEDAFAFSALPAGYRNDFGGYFNEGYDAYFWSSTESNSSLAYRMYLYYYDGYADLDNGLKNYGFSVRCLRDEGTTPQSSSSTKISSSSDTPESSSSEAKLSSSSVTPQSSDSETSVSTGTMTDSRDGQTYKTVTIGTQTWMAENLNYAYTDVPYKSGDNTSDSTSWCYNDDANNCSKYGRLYTWAAAMDSVGTWSTNGKGCGYGTTCSPTYPVRGICPEGWHLPTKAEFETLFTAVGGQSTAGKVLKSTSGWNSSGNGSDAFAFSALPAGDRNGNGNCNDKGNFAFFWSSTADNSNFAYFMYLYYSNGDAYLNYDYKGNGFSVRCLKD